MVPRMSVDVVDHAEIDSGELKRTKQLYKKDSLEIESCTVSGHQGRRGSKVTKWSMILQLAFQSIGVVYGDIGTSPLYVYPSVFSSGINHIDDILGVLSLIFYTLTLIPLIKYAFIVLQANDNGDGKFYQLLGGIKEATSTMTKESTSGMERDIEIVEKAWNAGVVPLVGENEVVAAKGSGIGKRIMIDYAYNFLTNVLRKSDKLFDVPHKQILKARMTYEL
ncbi:hypothetical protein Patl1_17087 [Pistacia atlantica]|uniref:Uncharacterized protein n=1 Tax=Pistacia atlantica TaxID=434234 RepID=A0ACC1BB37_9ROSI|nr:hypothetical protein Patl1_17087 [Pistacia atlantica]